MEKETKGKNMAALALVGVGIIAGVAIGYAIDYLIAGIVLGVIIGISLAWFVRLRGG